MCVGKIVVFTAVSRLTIIFCNVSW